MAGDDPKTAICRTCGKPVAGPAGTCSAIHTYTLFAISLPDQTTTADIPFRLRAAVIKWFKGIPVFGKQRQDIVRRLRSDAEGPPIHPGYYRQDLIDAADEIERLRAAVNGVKDPNYV